MYNYVAEFRIRAMQLPSCTPETILLHSGRLLNMGVGVNIPPMANDLAEGYAMRVVISEDTSRKATDKLLEVGQYLSSVLRPFGQNQRVTMEMYFPDEPIQRCIGLLSSRSYSAEMNWSAAIPFWLKTELYLKANGVK